jgi:predicted nucleotidyltransferase
MIKNQRTKMIISKMVEKIKKEYKPEKIILFGSYAYGKPTRHSDIDMFIVKKTKKKSMERWVTLKKLLQDPNRGIPFSPLIYTPRELENRLTLGDDFIKEILKKGKILYEKKQ